MFVQLKRKEAEMDTLSVEVVNELKVQLKGEKARLEREQSNAEILGLRKDEVRGYVQSRVKTFLPGFGNGWLKYCAIAQFWGGQRNILRAILGT